MTALKLDENLSDQLLVEARKRGFDAESVRSQRVTGSRDEVLFELCREEGRTLITLDLDFSDPLHFAPSDTAGTIVLRPRRPSMEQTAALFNAALSRLESDSAANSIWIIEPGRVRIYRREA